MVLVHCGYPWTYAVLPSTDPVFSSRLHPDLIDYGALAGNVFIGVLAVAMLTWGSKYLLRRIISVVKYRNADEE